MNNAVDQIPSSILDDFVDQLKTIQTHIASLDKFSVQMNNLIVDVSTIRSKLAEDTTERELFENLTNVITDGLDQVENSIDQTAQELEDLKHNLEVLENNIPDDAQEDINSVQEALTDEIHKLRDEYLPTSDIINTLNENLNTTQSKLTNTLEKLEHAYKGYQSTLESAAQLDNKFLTFSDSITQTQGSIAATNQVLRETCEKLDQSVHTHEEKFTNCLTEIDTKLNDSSNKLNANLNAYIDTTKELKGLCDETIQAISIVNANLANASDNSTKTLTLAQKYMQAIPNTMEWFSENIIKKASGEFVKGINSVNQQYGKQYRIYFFVTWLIQLITIAGIVYYLFFMR